jgi:hypothetical protein
MGSHAEYIRDGLKWDTWFANLEYMIEHGNLKGLHMMMTINSLSLFSITEFMDEMLKLREKYWDKLGKQTAVMSFNLLRFPSFMSIVTLPMEIRKEQSAKISAWLKTKEHLVGTLIHEHERQGILRTIAYIEEVEVGHYATSSIESRHRDFKSFYKQYDARRGKDFLTTFPELATWYNSIPDTDLNAQQKLIDGDSTKGWSHVEELIVKAGKEGWISKHSNPNPGSQDFKSPSATKSLWDM